MWNYITVNPSEIASRIVEDTAYWWSQKLDGHHVRIVVSNTDLTFYSKSGLQMNLGHVNFDSLDFTGELYGELIVKEGPSTNSAVSHKLRVNSQDLEIVVFGANDGTRNLSISEFQKLDIAGTGIKPIVWNSVNSRTELELAFQSIISNEGEGIVAATDSGFVYKIKPVHTVDLVILGYSLGTSQSSGQLRDLLFGAMTDDGNYCVLGRTSQGINSSNAEPLLSRLSSLQVKSNYIEVSSAKTAFVFIEPVVVAEFSCLDIQGSNSQGAVQKPLLEYSRDSGYSFNSDIPAVSFYSLVYQQIREDKKATIDSAGWSQISDFINSEDGVPSVQTEESTIELREVFTKESKNGIAVRKILVLKSNKENSGDYAPYYSLYTDFSPGRKSPLDTEIYLHQSITEATEKFLWLKDENIKKGWIKSN